MLLRDIQKNRNGPSFHWEGHVETQHKHETKIHVFMSSRPTFYQLKLFLSVKLEINFFHFSEVLHRVVTLIPFGPWTPGVPTSPFGPLGP